MAIESDADLATFFNADEFGVAAVYRPPGGSAADDIACVVLRDSQDREVGSDFGRPIVAGEALTVSAAQIAEPLKGGKFFIGDEMLTIKSDPMTADPSRRVWICIAQ